MPDYLHKICPFWKSAGYKPQAASSSICSLLKVGAISLEKPAA